MIFENTKLNGLWLINLTPYADERGVFARMFCKEEFSSIGFDKEFVQINHSTNLKKGTFRGLHYQAPPFAESKLIRCIHGRILDFIIDIREGSDTFLQHFSIELSPSNNKMLLLTEGFAHGYLTLEDNSDLVYYHTEYYKPGSEAAFRYNDPVIGIELPFDPAIISEKDKNHPLIDNKFSGIKL